ncbi:hypothetical protein C8R45DRAFT_948034 [Mycena sanguinolenta]|nr:hypothetical protein C8R45DRAFT_948034 [Mycena sanguinolenta]
MASRVSGNFLGADEGAAERHVPDDAAPGQAMEYENRCTGDQRGCFVLVLAGWTIAVVLMMLAGSDQGRLKMEDEITGGRALPDREIESAAEYRDGSANGPRIYRARTSSSSSRDPKKGRGKDVDSLGSRLAPLANWAVEQSIHSGVYFAKFTSGCIWLSGRPARWGTLGRRLDVVAVSVAFGVVEGGGSETIINRCKCRYRSEEERNRELASNEKAGSWDIFIRGRDANSAHAKYETVRSRNERAHAYRAGECLGRWCTYAEVHPVRQDFRESSAILTNISVGRTEDELLDTQIVRPMASEEKSWIKDEDGLESLSPYRGPLAGCVHALVAGRSTLLIDELEKRVVLSSGGQSDETSGIGLKTRRSRGEEPQCRVGGGNNAAFFEAGAGAQLNRTSEAKHPEMLRRAGFLVQPRRGRITLATASAQKQRIRSPARPSDDKFSGALFCRRSKLGEHIF